MTEFLHLRLPKLLSLVHNDSTLALIEVSTPGIAVAKLELMARSYIAQVVADRKIC